MTRRTISGVTIGAADTLIRTILEAPASIAWTSHWLISTLDSGANYARYADEMRAAANARGDILVVPCGVLAEPQAVAALRGSRFELSWFSELYLFTEAPKNLPAHLDRHTTDSADFEDDELDAVVLSTLEALGAYAYLADGDWLNFATRSDALIEEIAAAEKLRKERGW